MRENEASATIVLSARKRSDSNIKAPSRNGNQQLVFAEEQTLSKMTLL
ncbi:hypothetical protein ABH966_003803 [Lysinibacillus sp. RC46]